MKSVYNGQAVPAEGKAIGYSGGELQVPDTPIIPFIEGDGTGRCNCRLTDAYPYAIGPRVGIAYQIDSKTVFRAGWGASRNQARQFVRHGHVQVNGKRVTIPSYRVRRGDVVTIRDKAREMIVVQWNRDVLDRRAPAWLEAGDDNFQVTVLQPPVRDQIDVPVREQLIVELYSK